MVTRERVMEVLNYAADTGMFTWKVRKAQCIHDGDIAGYIRSDGYRYISLNNRMYQAGRLAFLIVNGDWPNPQVDHINGIRDDDRIVNLREVSNRCNSQNRSVHRTGKLCGVTLMHDKPRRNPWKARIRIGKNKIALGCFATEKEAHVAYMKACESVAIW